jgi:hypothetical protein
MKWIKQVQRPCPAKSAWLHKRLLRYRARTLPVVLHLMLRLCCSIAAAIAAHKAAASTQKHEL